MSLSPSASTVQLKHEVRNLTLAGYVTIAIVHYLANAHFAQIMLESGGELSLLKTIALASTSLEQLLGVSLAHSNNDLVATKGGDPLQMESQVVAIISQDRGVVDFV